MSKGRKKLSQAELRQNHKTAEQEIKNYEIKARVSDNLYW